MHPKDAVTEDCLPDAAHTFPGHGQDGRRGQCQRHHDQAGDGDTGNDGTVSRQAGLLIGQADEARLDVTRTRGQGPRWRRHVGELEERRLQGSDSDAPPSRVVGAKLCGEPYAWERGSERGKEGRERPERDATDHQGGVVALAQVGGLMSEDGIELALVE